MSVLISTCDEINKSCTNLSKSKQLYSFSKASRFEKPTSLTNNIIAGDIKDQKSKYRGASLGYGSRPNHFTKNIKNKSDNFYVFKSEFDFDSQKTGNPAYSFGKKLNYQKLYDENNKTCIDPSQPGPGSYTINEKNFKPQYSFSGRNFIKGKKPKFPGSGAYESDNLNSKGKYILSKDKNVAQCPFGINKESRFKPVIKCNFLIQLRQLQDLEHIVLKIL